MAGDEETKKELLWAENDAINALRQTLHSQEMFANRSLQLLNGGGAVALLAFLGQTWESSSALRLPLVISVAGMVGGLSLAVWSAFQLPNYTESSFRQNESGTAQAKYRRIRGQHLWTVGLSFLAFISAVSFLLICVVVVS